MAEAPALTVTEAMLRAKGALEGVRGRVEIHDDYVEGLKDLEGFSHIILIYHFHKFQLLELNHSLKGVYKKDNNGSSSWYAEHNPIIDGKRKTVKVSFGIKKYSEEGAKKMAVLAKEILKCKFSDKEIPDKLSLESRDILKKDGFWIVFYLFYRDYKAEFSIEKFGEEGAKQLALLARNIFKSIEEQRNKNGEFVGVTLKTRKGGSDYWYAHVNYNGSVKTESYSLSLYNNPKELAIKKRKQFVEEFLSKLPSA